nr:integrase, catalytic region, zinc finger, CCHC-type, peptidase aspartic, catalytic [Tanacetum cinerariifolium]
MTLDTHNWSSFAHQELHKIVKDEIFPIVNQVDARVQNFEIQFLKEAAKFVGDFKSLAKEADESLAKHKALELEIKRFLREVVSQDIISVVKNNYVVDTSNLQTELEPYKDMQQKIERLQAQLGDLKGKSKDTSCVSDTFNPLSQKLENENVELEFQDITRGSSANTNFAKQLILRKPPKVGETYALSKPVTANLIPTPRESNVVKNYQVIAPRMFRINPFKPSREEKHVPKKVRASVRTNPITVSQPPVITKKVVNSDSTGLSSTVVDNTKTRRPQPRSNTKNDRVSFASKSSHSKNKENVKTKVVCAMCKQCLYSVNHDVCLLNYVNGINSRGKNQKANVSINEHQKKQKPKVKKTKKVGSIERLASPKPSKPRSFLRWSPTGRFLGKIIASSKSESQPDCSKGDNACTYNPLEPTIKRFPISTFSLARTVRFGNDYVAAILGFDDLQWGNILITRVYFVEGLGHNLFSVGQFCDSDLEAEAIATACFTQNRSIIHRRFNKTPYELINGRKSDISFLYVFGALYYPKNDREHIRKHGAKGDIGFFIGYSADSCAYRVFNRRTKKIMKTMNVTFDELSAMAFEQCSSKLGLQSMTSGQITMYDDYIDGQSSAALRTVSAAQAHQVHQTPTMSTSIADTAPTPTNSSSQATNFPISSQDVDGLNSQQQHAQQQGNQAPI